jgi:cell wall-associated NlpC family hydrolase
VTPAEFIAVAESWIGVPYAHQGRSRVAVDCVGFVECAIADGPGLPEGYRVRANYGRRPGAELQAAIEQWCRPLADLRDGCLVQLQWPREELPSHLGIYAAGDLIHAYKKAGAVVRQPYRGVWRAMTVGIWAAPGVIYV